ncbi:MAG: cobaltochelatase subunit CobN [Alphaproteobacteria bacterium]|jgi:cobaltochelatase CobN|nr:cobaltochelatase subunit CobN [Alphaproteobacteria bacterium]
MHLLATTPGTVTDGSEPVDLDQSPGDIVVLSAADTDLALLAQARARRGTDGPSLRLANWLQLGHPVSVDLYADKVVRHARLVVVRLLGGLSYWRYGIEQLQAVTAGTGALLAVLPGDGRPDPELDAVSTLPRETLRALSDALTFGGPDNADRFLQAGAALLEGRAGLPDAEALPQAGLYWPGLTAPSLDTLRQRWTAGRGRAAILFYRALYQSGDLAAIDALVAALDEAGVDALPLFIASLRDPDSAEAIRAAFAAAPVDLVLNATAFAASSPGGEHKPGAVSACGGPVLQIVLAATSEAAWQADPRGLTVRDVAMHVALPEVDGRLLTRAIAFKQADRFDPATETAIVRFKPKADRIAFVAALAANWSRLRRTPPAEKRVALILANYPNRDGRLANGVGLDTPASTATLLAALREAGYRTDGAPLDGAALMAGLQAGPTNALRDRAEREGGIALDLSTYHTAFAALPAAFRRSVTERWGDPADDPFVRDGAFRLAVHRFGNIVVGIQPARGYNIDPKGTYHDPALPPPHGYLAFYLWLRQAFGAHAVIHVGKHGNLEWLPGKALALSEACAPEAVLGPTPSLYPFIVNDPGEGAQAKRRLGSVIVDHLTPPMTRAESHGPLAELEVLVDEYYGAASLDPRRLEPLRADILDIAKRLGLDTDCGVRPGDSEEEALARLDNHLCELKELQIRDGLHSLGQAPTGEPETDLLAALVRLPRGAGAGPDASLTRALAADLGLTAPDPDTDARFDPLDCEPARPWTGPRPAALAAVGDRPWRSAGDTVERLELLARALIAGTRACPPDWPRTAAVLGFVNGELRDRLRRSAEREIGAVLEGLAGRFVAPGPSGAPTRGTLDVLPTGRNFYSVDTRTVPTPTAWRLGWHSATLLVERHAQEHGDWPRSMALSAWGTSNMRTGGDDIAQALALLGVQPSWDGAAHRVTGFEVLPVGVLGRPRVDVTFRISGFFRDAFPALIDLFDSAVRAVAALDEDEADNPVAARVRTDTEALLAEGLPEEQARHRAGTRVFGSKPGAYGAGLQALIDEKLWDSPDDLAEAYLTWGSYAYGAGEAGRADRDLFERRLAAVEAVVHNQDNREHDLLDSDDYYQFEGGLTATVRHVSGRQPAVYHNDHSRPERPAIRRLEEEIGRVVRGRAANPKWLAGVMRHGYKGAFEIAATVDYLFAFAATTGLVADAHFDVVYDAYIADETVRDFMAEANPAALGEMAGRFAEAIDRGLWHPGRNIVAMELEQLAGSGHPWKQP